MDNGEYLLRSLGGKSKIAKTSRVGSNKGKASNFKENKKAQGKKFSEGLGLCQHDVE